MVTIFPKLEKSVFTESNKLIFGAPVKRITANDHAEKEILSNSGFTSYILPTILGMSANNQNFNKTVKAYMAELAIDIDSTHGKQLDNSFTYSISDARPEFINAMNYIKNSFNITLKTDDELEAYVNDKFASGHIKEIDRYKYGTPNNLEEYFLYVFCYYHSRVANNPNDKNNSERIKFYMVTKEDIAKNIKKQIDTNRLVRRALVQLDEKVEMFNNICTVLGIKGDDTLTKYANLEILANSDATKFLEAYNDNKLALKAKIEKYISANLLYRIPSSSIIVDMVDRSNIIGRDLNEAITFFSNASNSDYIKTLESAYSVRQKK